MAIAQREIGIKEAHAQETATIAELDANITTEVSTGAPQAGGPSGFFLPPWRAAPDPLRNSLFKVSLGNRYLSSVWTFPHTRPLRTPGQHAAGQDRDCPGPPGRLGGLNVPWRFP